MFIIEALFMGVFILAMLILVWLFFVPFLIGTIVSITIIIFGILKLYFSYLYYRLGGE